MWKHDIGGWATTGSSASRRNGANTPRAPNGYPIQPSGLESVLTNVTTRSSPPLSSSRPKSPLLNRSSPVRTPSMQHTSPSSLAGHASGAAGRSRGAHVHSQTSAGSFIPKSWTSATGTSAPPQQAATQRIAKVVFADSIDDRTTTTASLLVGGTADTNARDIANTSIKLPSLGARSRGVQQSQGLVSTFTNPDNNRSLGAIMQPSSSSTTAYAAVVSASSSRNRSKWVTVFGGTPGEFRHVIHFLSSKCGPIRRIHWPASSPTCNWLHVQFVDTLGAAAAVDKGTIRICIPSVGLYESNDAHRTRALVRMESSEGGALSVQFGVRWCEDVAMIEHFRQEDIEEEKARRLLCDVDDLLEGDEHEAENEQQAEGQEGRREERTSIVGENALAKYKDSDVRVLTAADRLAKLSEASRRFSSMANSSSALMAANNGANRSYANSFSTNALGGGGHAAGSMRTFRASKSGLYLSTQPATKAEARNDSVYVPIASNPKHKTAAEIWTSADVPLCPRVADGLLGLAFKPLEFLLSWWFSTEETVCSVSTAGGYRAAVPLDDGGGFFSFFNFFGGGYPDDAAVIEPTTRRRYRRVALHQPLVSSSFEAITNDVRTSIRSLPFYLDYGRMSALFLILLVLTAIYWICLGPFVDAVLEAIVNLVSFLFSLLGILFGGAGGNKSGGGAPPVATRASLGAPQWEYLYESNFNNDNKRSDYYSF